MRSVEVGSCVDEVDVKLVNGEVFFERGGAETRSSRAGTEVLICTLRNRQNIKNNTST